MGDISDYYRSHNENEYADERNAFRHKVTHNPPFTWWVKGDGTRIAVADMTIPHLMNCVNMIDRRHNWRNEWKEPLMLELEVRENELNEPE